MAMIVLLSVSACGAASPGSSAASPPGSSAAPESAAAPSSASSAAAALFSAEARTACRLAAEAPRPGEAIEIDEQAIEDIIENAGESGVAGIEQAGTRLRDRYSALLSAEIGDEAATAQNEVLTAVGRIGSACAAAGVTTA